MSDHTDVAAHDGEQPAQSPETVGASSSRSSRGVLAPVASALVVVLVAGGGFAAWRFLSDRGLQPAEVLPASTFTMVSVDLDPSAGQKLEALKALRKFPSLRSKLGNDTDLVRRLFEESSLEKCKVGYEKDVKPWVGQRAAFGGVSLGDGKATPVVVLQVKDREAAQTGFTKMAACSKSQGDTEFGWTLTDEYLVASDTTEHAKAVAAAGAREPLAEDAAYQQWTAEAGDPGIASFYLSKGAPNAFATLMDKQQASHEKSADAANEQDLQRYLKSLPEDMPQAQRQKLVKQFQDEVRMDPVPADEAHGPGQELRQQLKDFTGAAGILRFADGGFELASAGGGLQNTTGTAAVGHHVTDLPRDTILALAFATPTDLADRLKGDSGADTLGLSPLGMVGPMAESFGLKLPEDLETLLGDSFSLSVGGDAPVNLAKVQSPSELPIGVMVTGDPAKFQAVVAKVEKRSGATLADLPATMKTSGKRVAIATDPAYADALVGTGGLGNSETFRAVVPEADKATAVVYFQLDGAWRAALKKVATAKGIDEGAAEALANLDVVRAAGLSSWNDGATSHALLRVSLR